MKHFDFLQFLRFIPLVEFFPAFALGGFFGLFNKKITQSSETTNVDNTRVNTLTDSLNTWISQTKAESTVFNSAFDATNSFNTVQNYNLANIGGGPAEIPTLDFTGLRSLFSSPADLAPLLGTRAEAKDPNSNKYGFNFDSQSAGGNDFLSGVQGLVRDTWEGMAGATPKIAAGNSSSSMFNTVAMVALALLAIFLLLKFKK